MTDAAAPGQPLGEVAVGPGPVTSTGPYLVRNVVMPCRFLDRHVGGNTAYAQALAQGLRGRGIDIGRIPMGRSGVGTVLREQGAGRSYWPGGSVVHFVADTGPLTRPLVPSVLTVHGVAAASTRDTRDRSFTPGWRRRVARAIRCVDELVTVSVSSAGEIAGVFGVDADRIHVIPHGIDHDQYFPGPSDPAVQKRLGVPDGPYLLYVGNIEPRKNLVELVAAVETADLPRLVVAGRAAWCSQAAMEAITRSDRVFYTGFVSEADKVALLRGCAGFVFPSLHEGFGLPVLEALAIGVPVVCSQAGALSEVAGPAWRLNGLDRHAIRTGLRQALSDAVWLTRCATDGPAWAARFNWPESVDRHIEVYEAALRGRRDADRKVRRLNGGRAWN